MIYEEGIYDDIPEGVYHSDPLPGPGMSSGLAAIITKSSLLHAKTSHPKFVGIGLTQTPVMAFGSLCHAVLEDDDDVVIIHSDSYRTKTAKEGRDFAIENGRPYALNKDYKKALDVNEALRRQTNAFEGGKNEVSFIWKDKEFGIWCRTRCDHITDDMTVINDYKTTQGSGEPEQWCRSQLWGQHKYLQAALYCRGVKHFTGKSPLFNFVVQEVGSEPYAVSEICFDDRTAMYYAQMKLESAMSHWEVALKTDEFRSYPTTTAVLPKYLEYELDTMCWDDGGVSI